ncbi:PHD finger protein rhinoceros [Aricia agestis]|uniref:PHD finger protein rhinoceros n=1 Tax=Aricia agestis TaxID=91739 RepID=UPI001C204390|nr:PHD finger protein rhinoceros [Aricia agestis]XP_041986607.1 PHD finger protein rhinoceros [Aricia agestis]
MSLRGTKRATGVRGDEAGSSKRRRTEPEDALWQLRPVIDLKMSSIYNRSASEAPAELFRKDLISAMKLPDSEPLTSSEYWIITDTWKQDWERGVQVPVNPDSLPAPKVKIIENPLPPDFQPFKLPKDKYIHLTRDAHYQADKHVLSSTPARAEAACSYDLDATDTAWLKLLNAERARAGAPSVSEDQLEKVIEELEVRTWDKIQAIIKSEEGLGIEYDENVICDVCRSPDSEDGNEMVFCDSCNICVHQACYGITVIPDGQWLCRPCGAGVRPTCVLCPNLGGAMKCTPSGHKWAHVSCVLWIPEVSIGCAEKMEPITKITSIPPSRWSLVCILCRERKGACIQCSVKTCKTAYHVTCAFKHGLEMRAIIEDENADDGVKLRSYCQKHSVNSKKEKSAGSGSEEEEVKRKRRKDMTSEEKSQARAARLSEIEAEFDRHVSVKDISTHLLDVDQEAINYIYNYWKLKRRAGHNRPLLPPKSDDNELLTHRQEQADLDKMKMFVQLRQDLERVRNLCYMVSRREKLSRSFFRMREQTFHKQVAVLSCDTTISGLDLDAIIEANHGPSIYDRLYSHPDAPDHKNDFDDLLARIAPQESSDEKKKDRNGLVRGCRSANPYKKHYVNGSRRSGSMYSGLSSEESGADISRNSKYRGRTIGSSTDDDVKKTSTSPKKKVSPKSRAKKSPTKIDRKKKKVPQSKALVESSSEEEAFKQRTKKDRTRSKTLQQMEKEMAAGKTGQSGTDSDDLIPMRSTRNNKFTVDIYSDSSETSDKVENDKTKLDRTKTEKSKIEKSPHENDSQQSLPRTKAAMKEFIPTQPEKKTPVIEEKPAPKKRGRKPSNKEKKPPPNKPKEIDEVAKNKENIKFSKKKDPTDLIVPQRQAAKKASENMRSTTTTKKDEPEKQVSSDDAKNKPKIKGKGKEIKESPEKKKKISKDVEKEPIAYVPQRQAAKKAAAHIKSGLGSKIPVGESTDADKKKEIEKPDTLKTSPKKEDIKRKSPQKESSSSSSNTSSSSYSSSSSSEDEQEKPSMKPTAKAREIKPAQRPPSMFSPPGSRPTVDLPFLDKVSRPLSSTSASSDSDSSKGSRSGSGSPSPKRPRRRRKGKSLSTDASPRKAPDKKLKTSERAPEPGVSSSSIEGEESTRSNDTRATTRARTRSTTSSGNMLNKSDTRQRKPSKDESASTTSQIKTTKESSKSAEFTVAKRKADEEVNNEPKKEVIDLETTKIEEKSNTKSLTSKGRSKSIEDKEKTRGKDIENNSTTKTSPRKSTETKQKVLSNRRMSTRETAEKKTLSSPKDARVPSSAPVPIKERRQSRRDSQIVETKILSPTVKVASTADKDFTAPVDILDDRIQPGITEDFNDTDKNWLAKASSPKLQPPPVEKPGDHEKYMTEDKCLDSDFADKSSLKMIAKIQANLNENTMIKSPKTPMDARTMDPMDVDSSIARNIRKRSIIDPDKKFITQDASNVQAVEISKSAKIPSTVNPFQNRPMFSPQSKDNELFEFDMLSVEDSFNHDEILKPFAPYPELLFKEDSKEQGVQETFNLVDRLRVQLINKKAPADIPATDEINIHADKTSLDNERIGPQSDHDLEDKKNFEPEPIKDTQMLPKQDDTVRSINESTNLMQHDTAVEAKEKMKLSQDQSGKWVEISGQPTAHESHIENINEDKYDTVSYTEDVKEPKTVLSMNSVSEIGDSISLSKQSDDSQSLSVVDNSIISNEQDLTQDNQTYDNNNSVIHSDCATISSPYVSSDSKWRESKITTRRSSASSTNSDVSLCSQKTETKSHIETETRRGPILPEIDPYPPMPAYSCRVEPPMSLNQYTSCPPDASPFLNPISSLPFFAPGACASSQLPLPSPGPSIYGTGLPFTTPLMQPLPKPSFPLCAAAFTSSSQNIALTTAMIASPTPKMMDSPRDDIDVTGSDKMSIHVVSSPSIDSFNDSSNTRAPTKMSSDSSEGVMIIQSQDSKSPAKISKPVTKFPGKSPGKSPGISPKQSEPPKGTKRSNNRSNRSQRGRGRSKSRGQAMHNYSNVDYMGNSIASKLVGTVYDFDEEIANDGVGIKALRERRKSVDIKDDRKSENSYKDSSQSPRTTSPLPVNKRSTAELKQEKSNSPENLDSSEPTPNKNNSGAGLQPVLPGPVDMRTYNPFDNPAPVTNDAYNSHLLAFASGTADQQLIDIDEDAEKQLHSALMASNPRPGSPTAHGKQETIEPAKEIFTPQLPKVSLSDSRNQLKVKIKGPFLDANYSTSSVQPVVPQPPAPIHEPSTNILNASCSSANTMMSGSTNLRRMRKKELLRQYWTQDMNMDDPGNTSTVGSIPPPAAPQPLARAVITIPKAVASMTSIPTREDYKVCDTPIEKKKRKTTSGLSRELRHLEVRMNDEVDPAEEPKLPTFAASSNQAHKRRGRVNTKPSRSSATSPVAPKLKIKFGSNVFPSVNEDTTTCSTKKSQFRPPKKRLQTVPAPRFDVIKRESMKFRKMVMADFEDEEESGNEAGKKTSKHKPDKSEKKKKKKDKKTEKEKLQVINSESESATRLVIKIKRTKDEDGKEESGEGAAAIDPFDYDPTARDPLAIDPPFSSDNSSLRKVRTDKVTPIRLKLARSAQGSGYVMKEAETGSVPVEGTSADVTAASTPSASAVPLAVNKHCEVR